MHNTVSSFPLYSHFYRNFIVVSSENALPAPCFMGLLSSVAFFLELFVALCACGVYFVCGRLWPMQRVPTPLFWQWLRAQALHFPIFAGALYGCPLLQTWSSWGAFCWLPADGCVSLAQGDCLGLVLLPGCQRPLLCIRCSIPFALPSCLYSLIMLKSNDCKLRFFSDKTIRYF